MSPRSLSLRRVYLYIIAIVVILLLLSMAFSKLSYISIRMKQGDLEKELDYIQNSKYIQHNANTEQRNSTNGQSEQRNKTSGQSEQRNKTSGQSEQRNKTIGQSEQNVNTDLTNIPKLISQSSPRVDVKPEVKYLSPDVTPEASYLSTEPQPCQNKDVVPILILTPAISMHSEKIRTYFDNILKLTYSHCEIRILIGVNKDERPSIDGLILYSKPLANEFYSVEIVALNFTSYNGFSVNKHEESKQRARRAHIARVRNFLLNFALQKEDWVLWIYSDVKTLPVNIIETLISCKKDIIVPSCMYEQSPGVYGVYDRNTWRETAASLAYLKDKHENFLMLEGYGDSLRTYLPNLSKEGDIVRIDGVDGCCLLVNADVHRNGIIFPDFIFKHHIETEGFAKMAQYMGYSIYGMPKVYVYHQ